MSLYQLPFWIQATYAGLVGLVVGSFMNVIIYRLPRKESTIRPRSRCPACGEPIRALDNIPVVSWLALGGKCRHCKTAISARYPLIEALTGSLFAACVARFGFSTQALAATVFCCLMVVLAAIDLEHFLLPDRLTLPGIAVGLALQPWLPGATLLDAVIGALCGAGALILLINVWFWLRDEESMGLGDVNMLAMIGAFLGWKGVAATLLFASLTGAVAGLALMVARGLTLKSKLPFGFFLAIGGLVSMFAGDALFDWYLGLL